MTDDTATATGAASPGGAAGSPRAGRRIAGRPAGRWARDIVLIAIGVASLIFEPVSIAIHSIVGLAFVALIGPHLWDRRRWIGGTLAGIRRHRGVPARRRWKVAQALLLLVVTAVVTVSGLWDWLGVPTTIRYHAISGVILIVVATWHGWTRRGELTRWRAIRAARSGEGTPGRDPGVARLSGTRATAQEKMPRPGRADK
jgi:hypothetical protein